MVIIIKREGEQRVKKQRIHNELGDDKQRNHEDQKFPTSSNSMTKIVMIIIACLCFFLIISAILFGAYKFVAGSLNPNSSENAKHNSQTTKVTIPKIEVLSQEFHNNYMNKNRVDSYKGFKKGTSKKEVIAKYGTGKNLGEINQQQVLKYGDLGVSYKDNKIDHIFVIPKETTIQDFVSYHGQATNIDNAGVYTFDDNKQNDYMINVYVENNIIKGIENVKASENKVDFSDGVKNKTEAKAVAKRVLGFRNINIKIGTVTDAGAMYKVKYGKEDEADQNRILNIRKTDGLTTGDTTASN